MDLIIQQLLKGWLSQEPSRGCIEINRSIFLLVGFSQCPRPRTSGCDTDQLPFVLLIGGSDATLPRHRTFCNTGLVLCLCRRDIAVLMFVAP